MLWLTVAFTVAGAVPPEVVGLVRQRDRAGEHGHPCGTGCWTVADAAASRVALRAVAAFADGLLWGSLTTAVKFSKARRAPDLDDEARERIMHAESIMKLMGTRVGALITELAPNPAVDDEPIATIVSAIRPMRKRRE